MLVCEHTLPIPTGYKWSKADTLGLGPSQWQCSDVCNGHKSRHTSIFCRCAAKSASFVRCGTVLMRANAFAIQPHCVHLRVVNEQMQQERNVSHAKHRHTRLMCSPMSSSKDMLHVSAKFLINPQPCPSGVSWKLPFDIATLMSFLERERICLRQMRMPSNWSNLCLGFLRDFSNISNKWIRGEHVAISCCKCALTHVCLPYVSVWLIPTKSVFASM